MPMVRDGRSIFNLSLFTLETRHYSPRSEAEWDGASLRPLLDDEGWHRRAAPGGHVEQRRGREASEAARHVIAVPDVRIGVEHPVVHLHGALDQAGIRLARQRHALLDDGRVGEGSAQGGVPPGLIRLPAEDDALAAVLVGGLE